MKKKSIMLYFIFILVSILPLSAQTFGEADLERLIMNHKIMKNYDSKTGHFKNTAYELKNVSELKAENASKAAEIKEIDLKEKEKSNAVIIQDIDDEESFWGGIYYLSQRKKQLEIEINKNNELINSNGDPGYSKLYPIIDEMCNDIFTSLYNKDKIILNKLPRYPSRKPELYNNDLHRFWYHPNPDYLELYLKQASIIGLMFPKYNQTIIYQRIGDNNETN